MSGLTSVTLKDGYQIDTVVLITTQDNLRSMAKSNPFAFYDLVKKCKDNSYIIGRSPMGDSKKSLQEAYLLDECGKIHDSIRAVVLNSVQLNRGSVTFLDPIKRDISQLKQ